MSRYIDADRLLAVLDKNSIINKITYSNGKSIRKIIEEQPIANVHEVKHGKWNKDGYDVICSNCGYIESAPKPYCSDCGAIMDKE